MKKPNFFIVGAPKCGTTALSEYLKSHPQAFFSDIKEPNYFNTDFSESFRTQNARRFLRNEGDYLTLFRQATEQHRAIGEGTVWYLYSQEAIKNIQTFNPNSKIIVMLRNPIDLAYSLYRQQVYSFHEKVDDFETAWRLQERRERGESIPRNCLEPKVLLYQKICMLGSQLNRLYKVFPKDQVATIFFEDFKNKPKFFCCPFLITFLYTY